ncbi:MAG: DNA alkylation repair protein, partial [Wujia sp.]
TGEYYIKMAIAWYFSFALIKQYDYALPYIQNQHLDKWIHNKAIQKTIESRRVTQERKDYLRTLKIK